MTFIAALIVFVIVVLIALSIMSRYSGDQGLRSGKLQPCPVTPNCVVSEDFDSKNTDPIDIHNIKVGEAWEMLRNAVTSAGGIIQKDDGVYLWATFTTPVFRFVDDFEARLDAQNQVIQLRSASRVGHGDMGANKKRVEKIVAEFRKRIS